MVPQIYDLEVDGTWHERIKNAEINNKHKDRRTYVRCMLEAIARSSCAVSDLYRIVVVYVLVPMALMTRNIGVRTTISVRYGMLSNICVQQ
jgi:hypothetical protein